MLKPKCSHLTCSNPPIVMVLYMGGGGSAKYCKGHLTIARARSLATAKLQNRIEREIKL